MKLNVPPTNDRHEAAREAFFSQLSEDLAAANSLDEVLAANGRVIAAPPERALAWLRRAFEAGDRSSLLAAIRVCARSGLPLPDWASTAYIRAFDEVRNAEALSWDEVFGRPYPKGIHRNAERKRGRLRRVIAHRVKAIRASEPGTPIDEALFERVGAEFHIGKTLASELYYEAPQRLQSTRRHNRD